MKCPNCLIGLVAPSVWRAWSLEERRASGKRQSRCGTCVACYWRGKRPDRVGWKIEDFIAEAEHLLEAGESTERTAERLGVRYSTLATHFRTGRRLKLTTRHIPDKPRSTK